MHLAELDHVPLIRKLQGGGYRLALLQDDGKVRAAARNCISNSVQRHGAHRSYLRKRMDIVRYHFQREL